MTMTTDQARAGTARRQTTMATSSTTTETDWTKRRTLSVGEAARLLAKDEKTVRSWCAKGDLPARLIGREWRILVDVLRERHPDLWEEMVAAAAEREDGRS